MKPLPLILTLLLIALASQAPAQTAITADMVVSQGGTEMGTIIIEFDHVAAPMATANFIGLASGKLSWIDSATGVVQHNKPYYDGLTFHRVLDGFMNQGGSQNGLGNDGPGYSFQDGAEVNNGLDHTLPYRISMANSLPPDTNGSQFFLTAVPTPWLDGKHIVFGEVKEGPSRSVVEAINNVDVIDADGRPVVPVIIDSVEVDYHGIDFDPSAQALPIVSSPPLAAPITPASTTLDFIQPVGSTFRLAYSSDLANWAQTSSRILDVDDTPLSSFPLPGGAIGGPRQFFSPALVTYTYMPATLANRTFTLTLSPTIQVKYEFDATGQSAEFTFPPDTGTSTIIDPYTHSHYGGYFHLDMPGYTNPYWEFDDLILTSANASELSGTLVLRLRKTLLSSPVANYLGTFTLTK